MLVPLDKETGKKKKNLTDEEKKDMADRSRREADAEKTRAKKK